MPWNELGFLKAPPKDISLGMMLAVITQLSDFWWITTGKDVEWVVGIDLESVRKAHQKLIQESDSLKPFPSQIGSEAQGVGGQKVEVARGKVGARGSTGSSNHTDPAGTSEEAWASSKWEVCAVTGSKDVPCSQIHSSDLCLLNFIIARERFS